MCQILFLPFDGGSSERAGRGLPGETQDFFPRIPRAFGLWMCGGARYGTTLDSPRRQKPFFLVLGLHVVAAQFRLWGVIAGRDSADFDKVLVEGWLGRRAIRSVCNTCCQGVCHQGQWLQGATMVGCRRVRLRQRRAFLERLREQVSIVARHVVVSLQPQSE